MTTPEIPDSPRRPDGMPVSDTERRLRRLLCMARESQPYMDDGEASTSDGLDYMRMNLVDLEDRFQRRQMARLSAKFEELHLAGIHMSLDHPFVPVHELAGVLADLKAGKPFDKVCRNTIQNVHNYLAIMGNNH